MKSTKRTFFCKGAYKLYYTVSQSVSFQECLYLLNALHLKKYLRSSSQCRYWGAQWMARPYWWFKNQDAKNARCSRWIVFSFFVTFIETLKIKSGWQKGVFIFQRSSNVRSVQTIETIDSLLHYRNCCQCFIFTINPSLSQH